MKYSFLLWIIVTCFQWQHLNKKIDMKINSLEYYCGYAETDISKFKQKIEELEPANSSLESDVSDLKREVNSAKSDIDSVEWDVSTLKNEVSDLEDAVKVIINHLKR